MSHCCRRTPARPCESCSTASPSTARATSRTECRLPRWRLWGKDRQAQLLNGHCDPVKVTNSSEPDHHDDAGMAVPSGLPRTGQVALITGGSSGLGLTIATALAHAGSDVVLVSRSAASCEQAAVRLAAATGRTVRGYGCDVTNES